MTAVELLPPTEAKPANERWHELRRAGITASEIAIVMGISPYGSPFSLYWQKANDWRWEGNDLTSAGRHLEDAIADWWMAERDPLENLVAETAGLYAHPDRPWQLATPDRRLFLICPECDGEGRSESPGQTFGFVCPDCDGAGISGKPVGLIECKWVAYSWDGWGEEGTDEVPVHYRAQALWQLDTLGVDEVHFAALGPGGFRSYLIRHDLRAEDDLVLMRKAGENFVRRLAEQDPPPLDSHSATLGALKKLHPSAGEGDVEVSAELATKYRVARAAKKVAEERINECEAEIRAALGSDYGRAMCDGKLVASRSVYERAGYSVSATTIDKLNPGRTKA